MVQQLQTSAQAFSLLATFPVEVTSKSGLLRTFIIGWQPVINVWSVPGSGLCVATGLGGRKARKGAKDSLLIWYLAKVGINQIHSTGSEQTSMSLAELGRSLPLRYVAYHLYDRCTTPFVLS